MIIRNLAKKCLLLGCTLLILQAYKLPDNPAPQVVQGASTAMQITQDEFNSLTQAYQNANPSGTWGGMFGKQMVIDLINSINSGESDVHLRFCTDAVSSKTALILKGDKAWYQSSSNIKYCRNGGSEQSFCPSMCTFTNADNVSMWITEFDYSSLSAAYAAANPTATLGGNFDKNALMAVCNSLSNDATTVSFRFCTDPSGKTSVIFVGGTQNQTNGVTLIYRNGGTDAAFCPSHCE